MTTTTTATTTAPLRARPAMLLVVPVSVAARAETMTAIMSRILPLLIVVVTSARSPGLEKSWKVWAWVVLPVRSSESQIVHAPAAAVETATEIETTAGIASVTGVIPRLPRVTAVAKAETKGRPSANGLRPLRLLLSPALSKLSVRARSLVLGLVRRAVVSLLLRWVPAASMASLIAIQTKSPRGILPKLSSVVWPPIVSPTDPVDAAQTRVVALAVDHVPYLDAACLEVAMTRDGAEVEAAAAAV